MTNNNVLEMSAAFTQRHSRFYRLAILIIAIMIIAMGIYLSSRNFMNREWLTRAGCLVVILGIWLGIGEVIQERLLFQRNKWRRRNAITAAKARLCEEDADSEQVDQKITEINDAFDNQIAESTQNLRLSIGVLEVALLMTGTFLWGFGDLMV